VEGWHDKAVAARNLGWNDDALNAIESAISMDPKDLRLLEEKRDILRQMEDHEGVVGVCNYFLRMQPNHLPSLRIRGHSLARLGKYGAALESFDKAVSLDSMDKNTWNMRGDALLMMRNYEGAIQSFDKVLEIDPGNSHAFRKRGEIFFALGKFERALRSYEDALTMDRGNPALMNHKALALAKLQRFDDALAVTDEVLSADAKNLDALLTKGKILTDQNRYPNALEVVNAALALRDNHPKVWLERGRILEKMKRYEEASDSYDRAIDIDYENFDAWKEKGLLSAEMGDFDTALNSYERASGIIEEDKGVWQLMGLALEKMNRWNDAITAYDRAIGLDSKDKVPWNSKGLALMRLGRHGSALRAFESALAIDPDYEPALEGKRICEEKRRRKRLGDYGRRILEFEYRNGRAIKKEEAFRDLNVPFDYLDEVLAYLEEREQIDMGRLTPDKLEEYEQASIPVLRRCIESGGRYGLRLCDITANFPQYEIDRAKRILSYIEKVDGMRVEPKYDQKLDSLLRQALTLPPEKRTLLELVKNFNIGIYSAKMLDAALKEFAPEERSTGVIRVKSLMGEDYHKDAVVPEPSKVGAKPRVKKSPREGKRCRMHDGKAVMRHDCGEFLCNACTKDEELCPFCQEPLTKRAIPRPKAEKPTKDESRDFTRL
jgi:tetratricopeptide (TPR) repeat protein